MTNRARFGAWISIVCAVVSVGVGIVFYFHRTFFDETLLWLLTLTQSITTASAILLGLLFHRSTQGRVALVLGVLSIYLIYSIDVGIH